MKRITYFILTAAVALAMTSCKGWLTVDSPDRILEEHLFEETDGFYTTLNGVYIDLVSTSLYSGTFGPSVPDILAQYYDTRIDNHKYGSLAEFMAPAKKSAVEETWNQTYFLILNLNKIISYCDLKKGTVLNDKDFNLIKGECLGLRALLHFELFRLFAPAPSANADVDAIPYVTTPETIVTPISRTGEVMQKILEDFDASLGLLEQSDPVITSGKNETDDTARNLYNYRNQRLNYFAVKALKARACLYAGDEEHRRMAMETADEVIRDASAFFPFSTREEVNGQAAVGTPNLSAEDRVFSSDILFGVYNTRRGHDIYERLFSNTLQPKQLLAITENGFASLYPEAGDLRTCQWQRKKDPVGNDIVAFMKYQGSEVSGKAYPYLIPVIRMSELYLISAEGHSEIVPSNKPLAYSRLNALRNARKTSSVDQEISRHIHEEYVREFVGEGQLFWFYKRKNASSIPCLYEPNVPAVHMAPDNYVFELPQSEGGYR